LCCPCALWFEKRGSSKQLAAQPTTVHMVIRYVSSVMKYEDHGVFIEITAEVVPANKDCIVTAVYTLDDWKTVHNKNGMYFKDKHDKSIFRVYIASEHIPRQARLFFALQTKYHHNEAWDNNNGQNYEIIPERLMQICLPTPTPNKDHNKHPNSNNKQSAK